MVEPRENRVHMYLSNDEMKAIDDWRFSNRVATRSDAIRRLCQMGLALDAQLTPIFDAYRSFSDSFTEFTRAAAALADPKTMDAAGAAHEAAARSLDSVSTLGHLQFTIREMTGKAYAFKEGSNSFDETIDESNAIAELFGELTERMQAIEKKAKKLSKRPKKIESD